MLNQALAPSPVHPQDLTPATLSTNDDLVRLAAAPPTEIFTRLCWSVHRTPASLTRPARAWQYGEAAAMEILDTAWDPGPSYLRTVREEIKQAWDPERPPAIRITGNRLTASGHDAQLRLGTGCRLWYPYRKKHGTW